MRNLKKFLALVLAMLMVVSASATVSAFADVDADNDFAAAIDQLVELGITQGTGEDEEGNAVFGIDENVTRLQAAIFFARALTGEVDPTNAVWNKGLPQFQDVTEFQYAVTVAVNKGIINGMYMPEYDAIVFNPKGNITYIQALKMAVCALGYGEGLEWGVDGVAYYNVADTLGLTVGLDHITAADKALTRGEFAQILYNMINTEYDADGCTIAKVVFGVGVEEVVIPDELTTFIITATNNQTAYKNMEVTEGTLVGIQALVAGVPTGSMKYVEAAEFNFAEGKDADDYFLYAFDLVNYDAETGAYDRIDLHTEEVYYIFNNEITKKNDVYNRFEYAKENYYLVDKLSENPIKNEVVLYSTKNYTAVDGLELYVNAKDQVLDPTTGEPVLEKVTSVITGNVRYRVLINNVTVEEETFVMGQYLTYTQALLAYGVQVAGYELPYSVMDAEDLGTYYVLTGFDDNGDKKIDRAYYADVEMAQVLDPAKAEESGVGVKGVTFEDVDGNKVTLAKKDVIKYSYNTELNLVTVWHKINTAEAKGVIKSINTEKLYTDGIATITLEDGTVLNMYDTEGEYGKKNFGTATEIAALYNADVKSYIKPADAYAELAKLEVGMEVKYVVDNDGVNVKNLVYSIAPVTAANKWADYKTLVIDEIIETDFEAVYMNVYDAKGQLKTIAVTTFLYEGEVYTLADLTWIEATKLLQVYCFDTTLGGDVVKALLLDTVDGIEVYELGDTLDYNGMTATKDDDSDKFGLVSPDKTNLTTGWVMEVIDNIAFRTAAKAERLVVDKNTAWFFINDDSVEVYVGDVEYAKITADQGNKSRVYADKKGFGSTASRVYVFNCSVEGFEELVEIDSIVYMTGIESKANLDYYVTGSAAAFGLDTEVYKAKTYYKYNAKYALDMYDGSAAHYIYSDAKLANNAFYNVVELSATEYMVVDEYAAKLEADDLGNLYFDAEGALDVVKLDTSYVVGGKVFNKTIKFHDTDLVTIKDVLHETWEVENLVVLEYNANKLATDAATLNYTTKTETIDKYFGKTLNAIVVGDYAQNAGKLYDADANFVIILANEVATDPDTYSYGITFDLDEMTVDSVKATCTWNEYVDGYAEAGEQDFEFTAPSDMFIGNVSDFEIEFEGDLEYEMELVEGTNLYMITVTDPAYVAPTPDPVPETQVVKAPYCTETGAVAGLTAQITITEGVLADVVVEVLNANGRVEFPDNTYTTIKLYKTDKAGEIKTVAPAFEVVDDALVINFVDTNSFTGEAYALEEGATYCIEIRLNNQAMDALRTMTFVFEA